MVEAQNADVLQRLSDEQRAAGQPAPIAPTSTADKTDDAVPSTPVAPPAESVAKTPPVRRGSAAAT